MSLKILYLDDEAALCENFLDEFSSDSVVVATYTDPSQAIEAVKRSPPDLIFLDYRLPATNGDLVAQALDPKIPKFLISGDIALTTSYKFVKVFSKPYMCSDIQEIIDSMRKK